MPPRKVPFWGAVVFCFNIRLFVSGLHEQGSDQGSDPPGSFADRCDQSTGLFTVIEVVHQGIAFLKFSGAVFNFESPVRSAAVIFVVVIVKHDKSPCTFAVTLTLRLDVHRFQHLVNEQHPKHTVSSCEMIVSCNACEVS